MQRIRLLSFVALAAVLAGCAGNTTRKPPLEVWPDMDRQGKYKPQAESEYFTDHRASRRPVDGSVARGLLKDDDAYFRGIVSEQYVGKNPVPVNRELLKAGQQKYNTYCAPCHDRTGSGRGIVPTRTLGWLPANLIEDRVHGLADGELYDVITNGRRTMNGYKYQTTERERWAIVAYLRALQRAQRGTMDDVPADLRAEVR